MPQLTAPVNSVQKSSRSFDTRLWLTGSLLLPVLAMVLLWWWVHGSVFEYKTNGAPDGQSLYALSKLAGLIAIVLIGVQICTGLFRQLGISPRLATDAVRAHVLLGSVSVALVLAHVLLFFLAASIRNESVAWSILLPKPFSGYYELGLSLGIFGLIILFVVLFSGFARFFRLTFSALIVHRLALPAYGLLLAHAWMIGSESRYLYTLVVMGTILVILVALLVARIIVYRDRRQPRSRN